MNAIKIILFCFTWACFGQETMTAKLISKHSYKHQNIIKVDNFGTTYSFQGNTFYTIGTKGKLEYSNVQLGTITSANAFNPLKINLFYKDFNTLVILDNRLSEITKTDFNTLEPFRLPTHLTTANDNRVWLFNDNTLQLELFDYLNNKTILNTFPITGKPLDLKSNYNYCWLLTATHFYIFNYFGSLILKDVNSGFTEILEYKDQLILKRENNLYVTKKSNFKTKVIALPKLLIKQFFVVDETLYIYDGNNTYQFQLIND
ncbi:MAG: hypothetical protein HRT67_12740 [Flavobacteriaceae bacterium]|nr:hypothetical protein [Flavobacteriaceae bacterium]